MEYSFANGYGASVIDTGYGSHHGLQEIALLHDGHICYRSKFLPHGVEGWLTDADVEAFLLKIKKLRRKAKCTHRMS